MIVKSCRLVGRPIFFAVLIMLVSFLPIFAFGGQEGKLSHPLAFTKSFAMIGVGILAITFVPAIIPILIKGRLRGEEDNWIVRSFINIYKPMLSWLIDRPGAVWWIMGVILSLGAGFIASPIVPAWALAAGITFVVLGVRQTGWTMWIIVAVLAGSFFEVGLAGEGVRLPSLPYNVAVIVPWLIWIAILTLVVLAMVLRHWRTVAVATLIVIAFYADTKFRKLGGEFMPSLNEGSIMDMPTSAPRIAMSEALDDVMVRDRFMRTMPEVEQVVGKIGRAETATDPAGIEMVETIVNLKPHEWWPKRKLNYEDAFDHTRRVAAEMQRRGWLKGQSQDLLDTAAGVMVEKFDRAMRDRA